MRSALGASRWRIMRQLMTETLILTLLGGTLGVLLANWGVEFLARIAESQLYETPALNPVVYGATAGILFIVAAVACLIPARRATRVDPMIALREE
ncbi:MAG: FtsX-like permease family protein [Verrucomicrobiia bacterium]|jgi:ABC-type antimicrobial peptide transport system permease subunit